MSKRIGRSTDFGLLFLGGSLALGLIISVYIAAGVVEEIQVRDKTISVKGYAEQPIKANLGIWSASLRVEARELPQAAAKLERDRNVLIDFLNQLGFESRDISLSSIDITERFKRDEKGRETSELAKYVLSQNYSIESEDVALIAKTSVVSGDLLVEGLELHVHDPRYLYTRLNDLKLQMLEKATVNGRERVLKLISASDASIGALRSASQGVFQITPINSTEVSGYGMNDTSTIDKAIKAVVAVEYEIQ